MKPHFYFGGPEVRLTYKQIAKDVLICDILVKLWPCPQWSIRIWESFIPCNIVLRAVWTVWNLFLGDRSHFFYFFQHKLQGKLSFLSCSLIHLWGNQIGRHSVSEYFHFCQTHKSTLTICVNISILYKKSLCLKQI